MSSSSSEAGARVAILVLMTLPAWACATAIDNAPADSSPLAASGSDGEPSASGAGNASGGSGDNVAGGSASAGKSGAAGGAMGAAGHGASGAPAQGGATGSAGKAGASNGGAASSGGGAGKGGTSSGGAGKGGMASAGASNGGTSAAGASTGGTTGSATCDAAHAVATLATQQVYTGKSNDCVRLTVNPGWSVINLQLQPLPSTGPYPVPFSFFSCAGNGTGSLSADYMNVAFKSGANPGCDYFVQFGGNGATIKVTYYD